MPTVTAPRRFRSGLARFATGVTVVSFATDGGSHGFTVNSFNSVSLDPPLIMVGVARTAYAHDVLPGREFVVNVLGAEQRALASHFAGHGGGNPVWTVDGEAPRLADAVAYFRCVPWRVYDGGDHTLHLGRVTEFDYRDGDLLGFAAGRFVTIGEPSLGIEHLL